MQQLQHQLPTVFTDIHVNKDPQQRHRCHKIRLSAYTTCLQILDPHYNDKTIHNWPDQKLHSWTNGLLTEHGLTLQTVTKLLFSAQKIS